MTANPKLQSAFGHHQRGQLDQAAALYVQLLREEPNNVAAMSLLGVALGQMGKLQDGIGYLRAALMIDPRDLGAHLNLGLLLVRAGQMEEAIASYDNALALKPQFFEAFYNRGVALAQLSRLEEALADYDRAISLQPAAVCFYNRGLVLHSLGRWDEAVQSYDRAIALEAKFAPVYNNRGNALRQLGRHGEALESYDTGLALTPQDFRAWHNRGILLSDMERFTDAIASFQKAMALDGKFTEARGGLSRALLSRGVFSLGLHRLDEALADFDKAIELDRNNAYAWNGRGSVLHALKRNSDAIASFDKAIEIHPKLADAFANRGLLRWTAQKIFAAARTDLEQARALDENQPFLPGDLLHMKMQVADWDGIGAIRCALDLGVERGERVVRPFAYQALSDSPARLQACARIFEKSLNLKRGPGPVHHAPGKRLRVGYLAGEFREQATSYLAAGLYERHDRANFEVIAIDTAGGDASPMRKRLEAGFDRFLHIADMSDERAVTAIREAGIDILVSLNGYFGAPRMGVFAMRAAPLQVNYLGFPGTLGAGYMDYIFADRIVIPETDRKFYDEQVVYLPGCYQVNDSKRPISGAAPSRAEAGLPAEGFVFCNFNQSYKLTPETFAGWMRILGKVPGSVLWLRADAPPFAGNLRKHATALGIDPARLIFAPSLPLPQHLARLQLADLFLDGLPCNAHTTASDALWAGVPLLTQLGSSFSGRVAASLLQAAGVPELITRTPGDYESLAVELASHKNRLATLRRKIADNRLSCALFDTDLFRRNIETAYRTIWDRHLAGKIPAGFAVEEQN